MDSSLSVLIRAYLQVLSSDETLPEATLEIRAEVSLEAEPFILVTPPFMLAYTQHVNIDAMLFTSFVCHMIAIRSRSQNLLSERHEDGPRGLTDYDILVVKVPSASVQSQRLPSSAALPLPLALTLFVPYSPRKRLTCSSVTVSWPCSSCVLRSS